MDLVDEFVEIVLVTTAEVDECLDRLVGIGGHVLPLSHGQHGEHVVGKDGEVGDAVVDIGRFINADQRFIENGEEIAE